MKFTERSSQLLFLLVFLFILLLGVFSFDLSKYQQGFFNLKQNLQADFSDKIVIFYQELANLSNSQSSVDDRLPTPTPTPYVYHLPTQEQKNYVLALGAILSQYNNENMTSLKSNLNPTGLRSMMNEWWGITDRQSALETLDWLKREGQRTEYNNVYDVLVVGNITDCKSLQDVDQRLCRDSDIKDIHDIAKQVHDLAGDKTLIAWDFARLINVARWCYSMGWINEEEAWTYIVPAAIKIQSTYSSFEEFGRHYIYGRAYWMRDLNANKQQENILKFLINEKNSTPWTTMSWQTDLK